MSGKSRWVARNIECPEQKGMASLLLEWQSKKGEKVLNSISCDHPKLMNYSGEDCQWPCLESISRQTKRKGSSPP